MSSTPRVLALVPARAGSKRLLGKNTRKLGGKPLIAWTLEFAHTIPELSEVLVSTDAEDIAAIARFYRANVPWLRPAALASDTTSSIEVIRHALAEQAAAGKHYDWLVLLQPTSPFRDPAQLRAALQLSIQNQGAPVWSFVAAKTHPDWCYKLAASGQFIHYTTPLVEISRSQDLPCAYQASGSFYVIGVERFLASNSLGGDDLQGVIADDPIHGCDIDDEYDWLRAEAIVARCYS